ncbi:hypothetical protein BC835DRAFT_576356 [Cytidiella melzeri]|nr:hypothetical protein BC835DRAFT_576356 [Cytidiella melzeri]
MSPSDNASYSYISTTRVWQNNSPTIQEPKPSNIGLPDTYQRKKTLRESVQPDVICCGQMLNVGHIKPSVRVNLGKRGHLHRERRMPRTHSCPSGPPPHLQRSQQTPDLYRVALHLNILYLPFNSCTTYTSRITVTLI